MNDVECNIYFRYLYICVKKKWRGRILLLNFEVVGQEEFIFINIAIIFPIAIRISKFLRTMLSGYMFND